MLCRQAILLDPIEIPTTQGSLQEHMLLDINGALNEWGYTDNPRAFFAMFDDALEALEWGDLPASEKAAWVYSVEEWILDGDQILDHVQDFVQRGGMGSCPPDQLGSLWGNLSYVSFKVQFLMVGVEVRLDRLI
ncbi:hypothetical protein FKP32DRAFT_1576968 [Trametes sanguinea]|nr:hypothetical protein FKP32DRAFT_1576968 [Trametes sanguinea]